MIHVIGKDISKFHSIYWPAFLAANGMNLPKSVICHGHWIMNNKKMSKSLGNVIEPTEMIERFGINAVRAYFLAKGPLNKDINYEEQDLITFYN